MKDIHFNNRNNAAFLLLMSTLESSDITPVSTEILDNDGAFLLDNDGSQILDNPSV